MTKIDPKALATYIRDERVDLIAELVDGGLWLDSVDVWKRGQRYPSVTAMRDPDRSDLTWLLGRFDTERADRVDDVSALLSFDGSIPFADLSDAIKDMIGA